MHKVGPTLFDYFNIDDGTFGLGHFYLGQSGIGGQLALARLIQRHDIYRTGQGSFTQIVDVSLYDRSQFIAPTLDLRYHAFGHQLL